MTDRQDPDFAPKGRPPIRFEDAFGAAAMAAICVISFANVVVRYATDISFAFTEEFSVFLLVVMTLVGTAAAFATDDHIRISFFVERFGPRGRAVASVVSLLSTTLVFSLVLWYGALFALDQWEFEETSAGLGYPSWIYSIWLPVLAAVILVRVLRRAWRAWRQRSGEARP